MDPVIEFRTNLKAAFPYAIRAVSETDDFDFYAIPQVSRLDEQGCIVLILFPAPGKDFTLHVTKVEESKGEWIVETTGQRWSFRVPPEADAKEYRAAMKKSGVNV